MARETHVLVPVPEEHVEEVTNFLVALSLKAKLREWPAAAAPALLELIDPEDREILRHVGAANRYFVPVSEVAASLSLTMQEVLDRIDTINERCTAVSVPWVLMIRVEEDGEHSIMFSAPARAPIMECLGSQSQSERPTEESDVRQP